MENYYRRPQPNTSGRNSAYGRKRKKRRTNRTLLFTLILAGGFTVALVVYLLFFRDAERTIKMTETPISPAMTHLNTGKGLLYQTDGNIHYYDWNNEKNNYTYGTAGADIQMTGSSKMSAVYNANNLQIVGKDVPMTFTGTIDTVECGTHHVAVLRKDSEGSESLLILTEDGEQLDQVLPGDAFIVDFGFFDVNGEKLWVEMLSVTAEIPTTTLRLYDLDVKAQTGAIQVQSQLISDLYITNNSLFVGGTNQIIRYSHDGYKESYRVTVYGYKILDYSSATTPTFLMTPRGGDMHSVKLLKLSDTDSPETTETNLQLPSEGVAGFIMNDHLIVVSKEKMFTYTLAGKLSETAILEYPIERAYKLSDSMLLLESDGMFYIAPIS